MKKIITLIALTAIISACGGGGGGTNSEPAIIPITTSSVGTYALVSNTTDMTNISTSVNQIVTAGPSSNPPFTGSLKIGNTTWNKILNTGVDVGVVTTVGTYHFNPTSNTYGAFIIENLSGTTGKVGTYLITGAQDIVLNYQPENVGTTSGTYRVIYTETWHKISNTP